MFKLFLGIVIAVWGVLEIYEPFLWLSNSCWDPFKGLNGENLGNSSKSMSLSMLMNIQQSHTLILLDPTFLDDEHEYEQTRDTQTL